MAKNMTRKGLAIGAASALAVAGLVGVATPAQAAVGLLPSAGESNRVPITETFTLQTAYQTGDNGSDQDMSVYVVDSTESLLDVEFNGGGENTDVAETDGVWYGADTLAVGAVGNIVLTPKTTADETFSVSVITFFDSVLGADNNNEPDAGEIQSAAYTVNFHVDDDYTWSLDFTAPVVGNTAFEATVSTSPALNLAQFAGSLEFAVATVNSSGVLTGVSADADVSSDTTRFAGGVAGNDATTTYSLSSGTVDADDTLSTISTDGNEISFKATSTNSSGNDAGTTPTAVVAGTYRAGITLSAEQVKVVTAVAGAATVDAIGAPALAASADTSGDDVREGASATVEADVTLSGDAVDAGEVITVSISESGTWTEGSLTAGGETLAYDDDEAIEFTVTTNADGEVSFTVDSSDLADGDSYDVVLSAQGATSATLNADVIATDAANLLEHNLLGYDNAVWKVEDGTYTLRFAALDNFGQPLTGNYRVLLENGVTADQQVSSLSGGVATFSAATTDSNDDEVSTFTATLQEAAGASYSNVSGAAFTESITVNLGESNVAEDVTVENDDSSAFDTANEFEQDATGGLGLEDLENVNERLGGVYASVPTLGESLSGTITDAAGILTYGNVTLSGAGVLFGVEGDDDAMVYSLGSVTVQTSLNGAWGPVLVYSNTAGDNTVNVSSGNASQDIVITFPAADDATGTELTIDAPTSVEPGSTLKLSASLVDEYGNPVETEGGDSSTVVVNYDGPGFVVGDTPDSFDADGELELTVFLGQNDDGKTGTFTVSYSPDADNVTVFDGDDDIVKQATVIIGDAPSGEFNAWTKLSDDLTNVKFYAKNPSTQGKIQFFMNGVEIAWHRGTSPTSYEGGALVYNAEMDANYLVRDRDLVVGSQNVFEIYQDGTRIWRAVKTIG